MKLNGLELVAHTDSGATSTFTLACTAEDAAALVGADTLTIKAGSKTYKRYDGYSVTSLELAGAYVRVRAVCTGGADMQAFIASTQAKQTATAEKLAEQETINDETAGAIEELASMIAGGE